MAKRWKWWQVALGWVRRLLQGAHQGGYLPDKTNGPNIRRRGE